MGGEHAHGGEGGDFRAKVWSMIGGPYCRPKHWKGNTAIAMFGVFLVCIPIAMKSAELEVDRGVTSPADISMDITKLVQTLGISPVSFRDGVRMTLEL